MKLIIRVLLYAIKRLFMNLSYHVPIALFIVMFCNNIEILDVIAFYIIFTCIMLQLYSRSVYWGFKCKTHPIRLFEMYTYCTSSTIFGIFSCFEDYYESIVCTIDYILVIFAIFSAATLFIVKSHTTLLCQIQANIGHFSDDFSETTIKGNYYSCAFIALLVVILLLLIMLFKT